LSPSHRYSIAYSTGKRELHDCRMSNVDPKDHVKNSVSLISFLFVAVDSIDLRQLHAITCVIIK
jgi:hypothetical protein